MNQLVGSFSRARLLQRVILHYGPAILSMVCSFSAFSSLPAAEIDPARYISPQEVRRGMKGYGKTVMAGTEIQTFELEVISVMKSAWYAGQDVVLIRCAGLNLEHSGIVGGMSGSPCYLRDDAGRERLLGAVAFGWMFNKDPICGVQPITQMLPLGERRLPQNRPATQPAAEPQARGPAFRGAGLPLGEILAGVWDEAIDPACRFSVLNAQMPPRAARPPSPPTGTELLPLSTPIMISGVGPGRLAALQQRFDRLGFTLVASGAPGEADRAAAANVRLEPGSVLCIPLLSGDLNMEALGTCTEVVGDRVYGFGHALFGRGFLELPLATGMVHTVIPSVMRSNKLGASLDIVGTLWGDEASAIFGTLGRKPVLVPVEVTVDDVRGRRTYRYDMAQDRISTALLLTTAVSESIFAHNALPDEHTLRYAIEVEYENHGTFRTANFSSQSGTTDVEGDVLFPVMIMTNTPFEEVRLRRARVEVSIEAAAREARIDRVRLLRTVFKPGETVDIQVRWQHTRRSPTYTESTHALTLPDDLPDGEYDLLVGDAVGHLAGLQREKPHLWRAENVAEVLASLNLTGSVPENRLYLHLTLKDDGVAVGRTEMPGLPSYRRKILADARRTDVETFRESLVVACDTDFAVRGTQTLKIRVQRRNEL